MAARGFWHAAGAAMWVVAGLLACAAPVALAEGQGAPSQIGHFSGWSAYTMPDGKRRICYAVTNPAGHPSPARGSAPYLMVTHRPGEKEYNVVSIVIGAHLPASATASVEVGKQKFSFFTKDQTAWSRDSDTDKAVVSALAKGTELTVTVSPSQGTKIVDRYSLSGFSDALAAIDKACSVRR